MRRLCLILLTAALIMAVWAVHALAEVPPIVASR